jgi:hypothetical protein
VAGSLLAATLLLTGGGTTSGLKSATPETSLRLEKYSKVLVQDFQDKVSATKKESRRAKKETEMKVATLQFAELIAYELRDTGRFDEVERVGTPDEATLVINGEITRYEEGDAALRFMIGMGAGSSYFDAIVEFHDGATNELLGTIVVDKNSWVLGGGLAAGQTPQEFMREAAKKIAREVAQARVARAP